MSYIRMDKGLPRKPKFRKIARETGFSDHVLLGYLFLIWSAVDEVGQDFEGTDEDIACAVCAPSALVCALCAAGWATRFEGGITFNTNDPLTEERTIAHRARAARSYERRKASLRADCAPVCASAPLPILPPSPPSLTSTTSNLAPTRDAPRSRSKPKDTIRWSPGGGWQGITDPDRAAWRVAYPACDVNRQLAAADQWLRANPTKARKALWRKFVTGWLARAQERGGDVKTNPPPVDRQAASVAAARAAWGLPPESDQ